MSIKRVHYLIQVTDQAGFDHAYEALRTLLYQGRWAGTTPEPIMSEGGTVSVSLVQTHAADANGLAGLRVGVDATAGMVGGQATVAYTQTLLGSGGTGPYTFALHSGNLPPGLALVGATGVISGTPDTPGAFNFVITGTDAFGYVHNESMSIAISAAP